MFGGIVVTMKRSYALAGGCSNLSDEIRVISPELVDLGFMTVAEAHKLATALYAELVLLTPGCNMKVFRLVDDALKQRLRGKKQA